MLLSYLWKWYPNLPALIQEYRIWHWRIGGSLWPLGFRSPHQKHAQGNNEAGSARWALPSLGTAPPDPGDRQTPSWPLRARARTPLPQLPTRTHDRLPRVSRGCRTRPTAVAFQKYSSVSPFTPTGILCFFKNYLFCLFIYLFYFWLRWVFVAARRLSLVAVSGGLLFIAVCRLLIAVVSLCCRARALGTRASVLVARRLNSCGSWALEHRFSSCGSWA